ncbi:MAG: glycosyltransferase family 1 protein, partial [Proteobacteria bacterium]|nr:glycosyltransferase family 1 protein [Pseudomonadota bacterium]
MARIVMADDGISFDGRTAELGPLGGAEIAFASLAEALADRGHDVRVRNNCRQAISHRGVEWAPFAAGMPAAADLYIANRGHRLLALMPAARRHIFWIHNPASYLLKARYLRRLWLTKPCIVFSGAYHAATFPWWAPSDARIIIPYGIAGEFHG